MKSYLCLALSLLCFGSAAWIAYELLMQPGEIAFIDVLGDAAGAMVQAIRTAAIVLLTVDLLAGVLLLTHFFSSRKTDAKLRAVLQKCDEAETPRSIAPPNYGIKETARSAFTLIELLVVIAIIGILAALLMVGVMAVLGKGPEMQTRNELLQLSHALDKFKTEHGFYPPDRLILYPNRAQYSNTLSPTPDLDRVSLTYIAARWPNIGNFSGMPWAGAGVPIPASGYTLEGDQCLVFFLGGPPVGGSPALLGGFSTNPLDPVYLPPYTPVRPELDRKRFYDFDASRLVFRGSANPSTAVFPSFKDPYQKQVYAYFSQYKRENGYMPLTPMDWWMKQTPNTIGMLPYAKTLDTNGRPNTFHAATTYQIVSAGLDGNFGPGGLWPGTGVAKDTQDNMTNFHDRKLIAP